MFLIITILPDFNLFPILKFCEGTFIIVGVCWRPHIDMRYDQIKEYTWVET